MAYKKRTWAEKLADSKGLPKLGKIGPGMSKRWGTGTMVIPAPVEVDALMQRVPKGRLVTIEGSGHLPQWEQPEETHRELLDFLRTPS